MDLALNMLALPLDISKIDTHAIAEEMDKVNWTNVAIAVCKGTDTTLDDEYLAPFVGGAIQAFFHKNLGLMSAEPMGDFNIPEAMQAAGYEGPISAFLLQLLSQLGPSVIQALILKFIK